MILFLNVYITNNFITKYDRGLLGDDEDRVNIFKFSLASHSVIEWEHVIIYYELDDMFSNRYDEIDSFITSHFNNPVIHHYRNDRQYKWQQAVHNLGDLDFDGLIWYCCNDDHVFLDKDNSYLNYLKTELIELDKKYDYISCYFSHWPEMVRMIDTNNKYEANVIKDSKNYFLIKWRNIDSIQIVNKELLRYWWFENNYGEATLVRSDTPSSLGGVPVICPDMVTLVPYREIVRHFDSYSHVNLSINDCPPLFIPDGFFRNDIKINYCTDQTEKGYLTIDPRKKNYSTVELNGADYKCMLDEIPLFINNRISIINKGEDLNSNHLISLRNKAVLRLASADRNRSQWPPWKIKRRIKDAALLSYPRFNKIRLFIDSMFCWNFQEYKHYLNKTHPRLLRLILYLRKKFLLLKIFSYQALKPFKDSINLGINISKKGYYAIDYYLGIIWSLSFGKRPFVVEIKRPKPLVLVCRNKYYSRNNQDESLEKFYLDDSLRKRNLDLDYYFWDSEIKPFSNQIQIFEKILVKQPSLAILSSYSAYEKKRPIRQPSLALLKQLRERTKTKFVAIWWDTCSNDFLPSAKKILPFFDLNIINDNPQLNFHRFDISAQKNNVLSLYTPFCPSSFKPKEKDLDVVFLGQANSYRESRRQYINHLINNEIDIHISIEDRDSQVSYEQYQDKLSRAKIGLNFSFSVDQHQLKGRVFETMLSGAMLLESKNAQTPTLFKEGEEYICFSSKEDLVDKIKYYLKHENERIEISMAGRDRVVKDYNDTNYWDTIFMNIGLNG